MRWLYSACLALVVVGLLVFPYDHGSPEVKGTELTTPYVPDTSPPTSPSNLTITTPTSDATPMFTWGSASDADSGIDSYLISIDGAGWAGLGMALSYNCSTALALGTHTVEVKAEDNAGNQSSPALLHFEIVDITPVTGIEILSVTSPVRPGAYATLRARTRPSAQCSITVYYKSGPSQAQGLYSKVADSEGLASWTWKVGTRTTAGSWRIVVRASIDGSTSTQTTYFTVL